MSNTMLAFYRAWIQFLFFIAPEKASWRVLMLFATPRVRKSRERETEALALARAEDVDINGKRIRMYTWGSGTPTVLLMHGWEGRAGNMGGIATALQGKGYTCMAFDAPAHGDSDGKRSTLFAYSEVMAGMLARFPQITAVISHSFGSAASIYTLARHPHQVARLAMLSTPDRLLDAFNEFYALLKIKPRQQERVYRVFEKHFHYKAGDLQVSRDAARTNVTQAILLHDRNDSQIPFSNAEKVKAAWPALKLIPLQDVGHYRMIWNEEVIEQVMHELAL
ncbi:MAG: alpha/beta hydrolase [Bacteroidia bacterium]|jgi:pimeloyl-ACP methyl ester carboxylesterase|nr:alpha/beta hydrolase [Bacteroidia bacterium]